MNHHIASENAEMLYTEQGRQVEIFARLKNDKKGLYKAWIGGEQGRLFIGAFIPDNEYLQIRRTIAISRLQSAGCYPILKGGATLVHSFDNNQMPSNWSTHSNISEFFHRDLLLKECAAQVHSCLVFKQNSAFQLAIPYHSRKPYPFTPIFCFSKIIQLQGRYYILFQFDENERPLLTSSQ